MYIFVEQNSILFVYMQVKKTNNIYDINMKINIYKATLYKQMCHQEWKNVGRSDGSEYRVMV